MIKIGSHEFELDNIYEINLPASYITEFGKHKINSYLRNSRLRTKNGLSFYDPPYINGEMVEFVWKTGKGTFTKRLSKYFYDNYEVLFTKEQLTELGAIAKDHSIDVATLYLDITRNFNWDDGDFGDSDSCFWGSRSRARDILYQNGAYALRFYKELAGEGYGRCWLVPVNEGWIIFNGYGLSVLKIAQILSTVCGLYYGKASLLINGEYDGKVWIGARNSENKGNGYIIGSYEDISSIKEYNFEWDEDIINTCSRCGEQCLDLYYVESDQGICENCYHILYKRCDECYSTHTESSMYLISEDRYICSNCRNSLYKECDACHQITSKWQLLTFNNSQLCHSCFEEATNEN